MKVYSSFKKLQISSDEAMAENNARNSLKLDKTF